MSALTDALRAQIAERVAKVKELMPEMVPEIKALHEAGLIEGWRNVDYIGPHRPRGPRTFHAGEMVLESMTKMRERMK